MRMGMREMGYTKEERKYYNLHRERVCTVLDIDKNAYNWFRRKGQELHKIFEQNCNGKIESDERYEALTQPLYQMAIQKAHGLGLTIYFQTDPRGATIYLDKVPIPENNYTQAYCIY